MRVVKCSTIHKCNKCQSERNPIAVKRGTHVTLYCDRCGAYIKHASFDEREHLIVTSVSVEDEMPVKVAMLYSEAKVPYKGR